MLKRVFCLSVAAFFFVASPVTAAVLAAECEPPKPVLNDNSGNVFTDEQEMFLGEAVVEQLRAEYHVIEDEEVSGLVRKIGARLIQHIPETRIKFTFNVVDAPETNAFITPGGKIFVTRKLIAFVRNEDELAGILAHELGHGVVHHSAIDISKHFKKLFGESELGGRAEIFEKFNQFLDNRARLKSTSRGHIGDQQMEADSIGLFAMTAAGYNPDAVATAFDRLTEAEGKTGSWFSDFFGKTTPAQRRLREIVNNLEELPPECKQDNQSLSSREFEAWQTTVLMYKPKPDAADHPSITKRLSLSPALRDDLVQLQFSPDGKLILARDESTIFVVRKEPYEVLFRIDIEDVGEVRFSVDSRSVIVLTDDLRYERWSVEKMKPTVVSELYIRDGCIDRALSPSGEVFACIQYRGGIRFYNLATRQLIFENENFFKIGAREYGLVASRGDIARRNQTMEFSPSGRYFVAARLANTIRFGPVAVQARTREEYFAYDFSENREVKLPGSIKSIVGLPFAFLSDSAIVGQHDKDPDKSGVFEFPTGARLQKFELKANSLTTPYRGNYVLVRPIKVAPVGVYDLNSKKFVLANQKSALAVYDNSFISENKDGVLGHYRLDKDETIGQLQLPDGRLGRLRTIVVSPDLNWIAMSDRSRGGIWSLFSGERFGHTRGFSGAYFDRSGKVFLDFLPTKQTRRQIGVFNVTNKTLSEGSMMAAGQHTIFGDLLLVRQRSKKSKNKSTISSGLPGGQIPVILSGGPGTVEIQNVMTRDAVWKREFEKSMPSIQGDTLHGTLSMVWPLRDDEVKRIIKDDKELRSMASKRKESRNDYYLQAVDMRSGNVLGGLPIETGRGSFRIRSYTTAGDWVAIADSQNRVKVYSLANGERLHDFFGNRYALSAEANLIAVGNGRGEMSVYDLLSGRMIGRFRFGKPISYVTFGKYGKKLLVLTNDQEATVFAVSKLKDPVPTP